MKRIHIAILSLAAAAATAQAQDLVKEIDVNRTIVPAEREATRPSQLAPNVFAPEVAPARLSPARYSQPSAFLPAASLLPPARWGQTVERTPYRGYAAIGYFPVYNLGATAGYRIIDTETTGVGAWAMYNGNTYKISADPKDITAKNHFFSVGLNGRHSFSAVSTLTAEAMYRHASFTHPDANYDAQGASDFRFSAAWHSQAGKVGYQAKASVERFAFSKEPFLAGATPMLNDALGQTSLGIAASGVYDLTECVKPGLEVDFDYLTSNNYLHMALAEPVMDDARWGVMRVQPNVQLRGGAFTGRLGANVSIGTACASGVKVAPAVRLALEPKAPASVWVSLEGGMGQNRAADMHQRDYTFVPIFAIGTYNVPLAVEAGARLGSFSGFTATARFRYAKADNYELPWLQRAAGITPQGYDFDISGLMAGVELAYECRLLKASASFDLANSSDTDPGKGWYMWGDRAKRAFAASVEVYPIPKLTVGIGYENRGGRHTFAALEQVRPAVWEGVDLGTVSNLNLNAKYELRPEFTIFLTATNLLNHRYSYSSGFEAPGIHGLAGVALKF